MKEGWQARRGGSEEREMGEIDRRGRAEKERGEDGNTRREEREGIKGVGKGR